MWSACPWYFHPLRPLHPGGCASNALGINGMRSHSAGFDAGGAERCRTPARSQLQLGHSSGTRLSGAKITLPARIMQQLLPQRQASRGFRPLPAPMRCKAQPRWSRADPPRLSTTSRASLRRRAPSKSSTPSGRCRSGRSSQRRPASARLRKASRCARFRRPFAAIRPASKTVSAESTRFQRSKFKARMSTARPRTRSALLRQPLEHTSIMVALMNDRPAAGRTATLFSNTMLTTSCHRRRERPARRPARGTRLSDAPAPRRPNHPWAQASMHGFAERRSTVSMSCQSVSVKALRAGCARSIAAWRADSAPLRFRRCADCGRNKRSRPGEAIRAMSCAVNPSRRWGWPSGTDRRSAADWPARRHEQKRASRGALHGMDASGSPPGSIDLDIPAQFRPLRDGTIRGDQGGGAAGVSRTCLGQNR